MSKYQNATVAQIHKGIDELTDQLLQETFDVGSFKTQNAILDALDEYFGITLMQIDDTSTTHKVVEAIREAVLYGVADVAQEVRDEHARR